MTDRPLRNVAASIKQRLTNTAKQGGRPFQEVLQYFAMERFLYRLSLSPHVDKLILKGALMFTVWGGPPSRSTRDIDLLARMNNSVEAVLPVIREVCLMPVVDPDGLIFDVDSLSGQVIKEDADYSGVRVTFKALLEKSHVPMQIDIGFGDTIVPEAHLADYPTILDFAAPRLHTYPKETVIAEKFEAMVKLGLLNSRLKDFYDLWTLSRLYEFDGKTLSTAVSRTFENRHTAIDLEPVALTDRFANDPSKASQWKGFLRKSGLTTAPPDLSQVVEAISEFLLPVAKAINDGQTFSAVWHPSGPWQNL